MSNSHIDKDLAINRKRQKAVLQAVRRARDETGAMMARGDQVCVEAHVDQARRMAVRSFDIEHGLV